MGETMATTLPNLIQQLFAKRGKQPLAVRALQPVERPVNFQKFDVVSLRSKAPKAGPDSPIAAIKRADVATVVDDTKRCVVCEFANARIHIMHHEC